MMTPELVSSANIDTYFARMLSSLGDKKRVFAHLPKPPPTGDDESTVSTASTAGTGIIVDVGCGDGSLVKALSAAGYNAVGIDASDQALARCAENGVIAYQGAAHTLDTVLTSAGFAAGEVDAFICSAVLHEVFSYGSLAEVETLFAAMSTMLAPGGRIIVRDGINAGEQRCVIEVDDVMMVQRFMDESPFSVRNADKTASSGERTIDLEYLWGNRFEGSKSSCAEFAFTYTWGMASWAREVQELYGVFTRTQLEALAAQYSLDAVFFEEYVQQGYLDALRDKVEFIDTDFPSTNAVWVFSKV